MKSIKVCEYSRSRSFHDDLILQDQASGERSQDQWSSGVCSGINENEPGQPKPTTKFPNRSDKPNCRSPEDD